MEADALAFDAITTIKVHFDTPDCARPTITDRGEEDGMGMTRGVASQ